MTHRQPVQPQRSNRAGCSLGVFGVMLVITLIIGLVATGDGRSTIMLQQTRTLTANDAPSDGDSSVSLAAAPLESAQFSFTEGPSDTLYQQNVDAIVSYGVSWLRFGISSWDIVNGCTTTSINWNDAGFTKYDTAVNYALSKGMRIDLLTADSSSCAAAFSETDYNNFIAQYATRIAQRYAGKLTLWQMYNEADSQDFQNQSAVVNPIPQSYLMRESNALSAVRTAVRSVDPTIQLTTTSSGYPVSATQEQHWDSYFDGISGNLDVISLDLYPETNRTQVDLLGAYVSNVHARYGKPVSVGEFGINTCTTCVTSDAQGQMLTSSIASLKQGAGLEIAFIYGYKDVGWDQNNGEDTFGIVDYNNHPKSDYTSVMTAIQQANSDLRDRTVCGSSASSASSGW